MHLYRNVCETRTNIDNYYFTFGFGQANAGCYYVIENTDYGTARERIIKLFGNKWAFQYSEKEWVDEKGISQAEKYNYKRLKYNKKGEIK